MELGQRFSINNIDYFIGDVVLLTHIKTNVSAYYQIIWNTHTFQIVLENETNKLASIHPHGNSWHTEAYIQLFKVVENYIPYLRMKRIGNSKSDLKLIKRVSRVGLKPTK